MNEKRTDGDILTCIANSFDKLSVRFGVEQLSLFMWMQSIDDVRTLTTVDCLGLCLTFKKLLFDSSPTLGIVRCLFILLPAAIQSAHESPGFTLATRHAQFEKQYKSGNTM